MGPHVFMNLLNKLRTRAKMRNNTGARMLDFIYAIRGALMYDILYLSYEADKYFEVAFWCDNVNNCLHDRNFVMDLITQRY